MSFISFFGDDRGFLASDQRVFGAEEVSLLHSVIEQSSELSHRLATQSTELQLALEAARDEGRANGLAEGREAAAGELSQKLLELHTRNTQLSEQLKGECAELAVEIVRKIAGQIAPTDWLLAQAVQASEELVDRPEIALRVHVEQQEAIKARCESLSISRFASVIGDADVTEQTCILETHAGRVEVDLETQLAQVLDMLADGNPSNER